jgi:hypothetical protein
MQLKGKVDHIKEPLSCVIVLGTVGSVSLVLKPGGGIDWVHVGGPPPEKLTRGMNSAFALIQTGMHNKLVQAECYAHAKAVIGTLTAELGDYVGITGPEASKAPKDCYVILWSNGSSSLVWRPGEGIHWIHVGDPPRDPLASTYNSAQALFETGMRDEAVRPDCINMAKKLIAAHETELRKAVESQMLVPA